jgi:hypothetical protein
MARVDLYWLPLGAGGHSVRVNGQVFEALVALRYRRQPSDLYHSALTVALPEGEFVIEQAPVRRGDHGAVASGSIGSRLLPFRYEVRRWRGGAIPDVDEAVDSPQRLTEELEAARRLLELVPHVPTPTWGRDELATGEMWNSNSVVSWLVVRAGIDPARARIPRGGRAPGWDAGLAVARR